MTKNKAQSYGGKKSRRAAPSPEFNFETNQPLSDDKREHMLRNMSGVILCPECEKKFLYIGDGFYNPSLFCMCGFRTFIKLFANPK